MEKAKEFEKHREEEKLKSQGCPLQRAEQRFYECINKIMKEREEKAKELLSFV